MNGEMCVQLIHLRRRPQTNCTRSGIARRQLSVSYCDYFKIGKMCDAEFGLIASASYIIISEENVGESSLETDNFFVNVVKSSYTYLKMNENVRSYH